MILFSMGLCIQSAPLRVRVQPSMCGILYDVVVQSTSIQYSLRSSCRPVLAIPGVPASSEEPPPSTTGRCSPTPRLLTIVLLHPLSNRETTRTRCLSVRFKLQALRTTSDGILADDDNDNEFHLVSKVGVESMGCIFSRRCHGVVSFQKLSEEEGVVPADSRWTYNIHNISHQLLIVLDSWQLFGMMNGRNDCCEQVRTAIVKIVSRPIMFWPRTTGTPRPLRQLLSNFDNFGSPGMHLVPCRSNKQIPFAFVRAGY